MDKKVNSYAVIIAILLLVVTVVVGAGLCYLSWTDEEMSDSTHVTTETQIISTETQETTSETEQIADETLASETEVSVEEVTTETESSETETVATETESTEVQEEVSEQGVTIADITINEQGKYEYQKDGIVLSKQGIDVSKYQGNIDWTKVAKQDVTYAMLRVGCRGYGTNGTLIKDDRFEQNAKGALKQGIQIGAYFFSQAITEKEVLEEADFVINELKAYDITYPVAINIEAVKGEVTRQDVLSKEERTKLCIVFCEAIKEAGYTPMIYGDVNSFENLLDIEQLAEYDLWICETDDEKEFTHEFVIWQYSREGSVSGISGNANMSICVKEW